MPKVVIVPLSLYMNNQQQRTVDAFKKLGIGAWEMRWQFLPFSFLDYIRGPSLPAIFDAYKKGECSTDEFREAIRQKFPTADLSDQQFDAAWNAMLEVTELTKSIFQEIEALTEKGIQVYLFSSTNPLHIDHIKAELNKEALPSTSYFSYEHHKLGNALFSKLLEDIKQKDPTLTAEDIACFYRPPQDPQLGRFTWLTNPFKTLEFRGAQRYVAELEKQAASNGFQLISCPAQQDNQANILQAIENLGWVRKDPAEQLKMEMKGHPEVFEAAIKKAKTTEEFINIVSTYLKDNDVYSVSGSNILSSDHKKQMLNELESTVTDPKKIKAIIHSRKTYATLITRQHGIRTRFFDLVQEEYAKIDEPLESTESETESEPELESKSEKVLKGMM